MNLYKNLRLLPEEIDKANRIQFFLQEAFCIDGKCTFHAYTDPIEDKSSMGMTFLLSDSKRGNFYVTIHKDK